MQTFAGRALQMKGIAMWQEQRRGQKDDGRPHLAGPYGSL